MDPEYGGVYLVFTNYGIDAFLDMRLILCSQIMDEALSF
jgi:hypothetical protein